MTTHSNIVIDLFGKDRNAQILHVTHEGGRSEVKAISTYLHSRSVLQDLDVRASDLLQSNAVVWVEGPSDRIYFNRWIELWDSQLKEGIHYQCLYSAGRLIEGFSFDAPDDDSTSLDPAPDTPTLEEGVKDFIEALRINRHSIVMMDRDRAEGEDLKPWVSRIVSELEALGGVPWVTMGREVENYIPIEDVCKIVSDKNLKMLSVPGKYDEFFECIVGPRGGDASGKKTAIARDAAGLLDIVKLKGSLDLEIKLRIVCQKIREWNGLPPNPSPP